MQRSSVLPMRVGCVLLVGASLLLFDAVASAEEPTSAETPDPAKKEALARFNAGLLHFDREEWGAALAEFLKSREIYPTRAATRNAAVCLRKQGRFDEALNLYEALVRDYPDLSEEDKAFARKESAELQDSIGTLDIRGAVPGATILVDGRDRGSFPLLSPLRVSAGSRLVRVAKDGFAPFEAQIDVAGRQAVAIEAHLAPLTVQHASAFVFEVVGSAGVVPLFGGDVVGACTGSCSQSLPLDLRGVVHGGYELSSGLGFSVDAGFVRMSLDLKNRAAQLDPVGGPTNAGTFDDALVLSGLTLGGSAFFHRGDVWPFTLRVGVGGLIGSTSDHLAGNFKNSMGDAYAADVAVSDSANYLYLAPEARIGRRLGAHFEVSIGVELMVLASIRQPMLSVTTAVSTASPGSGTRGDGLAYFPPSESLAASLLLAVAPSVGARYDF